MALNLTEIKKAKSYLEKATALLTKEDQKAYFNKNIASAENAMTAMADNEEKAAYLHHAIISWCTQVSLFLLREDLFSDELVAEYRSLPLPEETQAKCKEFADIRQAEIDRINEEQRVVSEQRRGFEIFQAIVGGMDKEEAKQKMEEYEEQMAKAQAQVARG